MFQQRFSAQRAVELIKFRYPRNQISLLYTLHIEYTFSRYGITPTFSSPSYMITAITWSIIILRLNVKHIIFICFEIFLDCKTITSIIYVIADRRLIYA